MTIRQATIEDLPLLEPCAKEFYASSENLHDFEIGRFVGLWRTLISNGSGAVFILKDGDEVTGAIAGLLHQDPYSAGTVAQEMYWFVRAAARGGGVRLYRELERWAVSKGATELRMGYLVDLMPEKVAHFYERVGFRKIEVGYSKRLECAG